MAQTVKTFHKWVFILLRKLFLTRENISRFVFEKCFFPWCMTILKILSSFPAFQYLLSNLLTIKIRPQKSDDRKNSEMWNQEFIMTSLNKYCLFCGNPILWKVIVSVQPRYLIFFEKKYMKTQTQLIALFVKIFVEMKTFPTCVICPRYWITKNVWLMDSIK